MKVHILSVLVTGMLFSSICGSDQAIKPVYPANVPAPSVEPIVRQPSARTKEYKQAFKTERLKAKPLMWQGSWLQRQSQRAWNWMTGAPTARAINYEKAYALQPQQQESPRGAATFRAYVNAMQRDRDVAARENAKAYAAARNYEVKIKSIESDMKVNRREKRELGSWPENESSRKKFDDQYRKLSTQKAMLEKEENKQWSNARYWKNEAEDKLLEQYSTLMSGLEYLGR